MGCSSPSLFDPRFLGEGGCRCLCLSFHWLVFSSFPLVGTIDVGKTRLMFWDLGGQEELQSLWDKVGDVFLKNTSFFFFRDVCVSQSCLCLFEQRDHSVQASWQPECLASTLFQGFPCTCARLAKIMLNICNIV